MFDPKFHIIRLNLWSGLSLHLLAKGQSDVSRTVSALSQRKLTINMVNNCINCNKITKNPKFCSKSCSAKINNKIPKRKTTRKCTQCGNTVRNYRSTLCEHHFQEEKKNKSEYIKNLTIADYISRDSIKRLHASSKYAHVRLFNKSWNKTMSTMPCYNCGYSKHVELAYIKPIHSFPDTAKLGEVNDPSNIVQLCPNCHWEFDNGLLTLVFPEQ
jgi:hypothetical protein